jgi:hypothetical protein
MNRFQINSYIALEQWFQEVARSTSINAHLIESLLEETKSSVPSRPCILSAYGTNNKFSAVDLLRKWIYIYNEYKQRNINRI